MYGGKAMFSFDSVVRYSETDHKKQLTPSTIINYFQDCSNFHSEAVHAGMDFLNQTNRAWLMCSWQLIITRYPKVNEKITISTWPYEFISMYGYRNFMMQDEQKNTIAYANSIWALIDTKTQHPTKIQEEDKKAYTIEPPYPMEYANRKLLIPSTFTKVEPFSVQVSSLDMFEHVNNGEYIRFAHDLLPNDFTVREVCAEYKRPALLGDMIYPLLHIEQDKTTILLANKEEKPYAIVQFYK